MRSLIKQTISTNPVLMPLPGLLALILFNCLFLAACSYFYPLILPPVFSVEIFIYNLLPMLLFSLLCWLLTARLWVSILLTVTLFDAVFLANQMKMANLGQPSTIADYISVFSLVGGSNLLGHYFTSYWHLGVLATLLLAALVLLFVEKPTLKLGLGLRLVSTAMAVLMLNQLGASALRTIYQPGEAWEAWKPDSNLYNFGLLYSLSHGAGQFASGYPEYDDEALASVLQEPSPRLLGAPDGLPEVHNIIVVLSESFFDVSDLKGIEKGQYDLPAYRQLESRALTGKIQVPAYGGATLRTEFELLTGIGLELFPSHDYPFISLVLSPLSSIVWDARNAGYSTTAIHPNTATFWSRNTAYPLLGFETFLDEKSFRQAKRSGYYVADEELTNVLIQQVGKDKKQFLFAISMENHGPWVSGRKNLDEEKVKRIEPPAALEGESRVALQQYIYHLQAAQAALLDLIDELHNSDARSVVLFFGDHLPALTQPFDDLGFKNGESRFQQTTPYLIYDTRQNLSGQQHKVKPVIDVTLLGSLLMDIALQELPLFHAHAERLGLADSMVGTQPIEVIQTGLQQLQLWRFWQQPLDPFGEPWKVGGNTGDGAEEPVLLEPLACNIEQWGPHKTYVGEGFNVQPDGQSAFYVKTDCAGLPLDIHIDGEAMWTTRQGDVLSTALDAEARFNESGRYTVKISERTTGRTQTVGVFKVKRRWWPK